MCYLWSIFFKILGVVLSSRNVKYRTEHTLSAQVIIVAVLNLPQPSHLSVTFLRNSLNTFNLAISSFDSLPFTILLVVMAAALYTINMAKGGSIWKLIGCDSWVTGSTALTMVPMIESSDSAANTLQSSVPAAGVFVPFSYASNNALSMC